MANNLSIPNGVLMACPGTAVFMQQAALALQEAGLLQGVAVPFADSPTATWRAWLVRLGRALGKNLDRQLSRRSLDGIPEEKIRRKPAWEILRTVVSQMDQDGTMSDRIFELGNDSYDRWVARRFIPKALGTYGFEYGCLHTFRRAAACGLFRIYDVPATEHEWWHRTLVKQTQQYPETKTPFLEYSFARHAERTERRKQEYALADRVFCNSEFAKQTFAAGGYDVSKVRVIPYGAPPVHTDAATYRPESIGTLRVLWVGSFSLRKGAHLLLQAWRGWTSAHEATLQVFGSQQLPASLLENLPEGVTISPTIPRVELERHYLEADVLIFPTLCDGFGMVVTEALAHGLPVITTDQAGASQFIQDGENGFIIPADDVTAICNKLQWCVTHRRELATMKSAAAASARRWQWEDYRKEVAQQVLELVASKS